MTAAAQTDTFRLAFLDEAREILVELEAALLKLNENVKDAELVGRVFRALHTLKGSGSMFGFDKLAAFTHSLETAFDAVRNGRLAVTPDLVDLTLAAMDQIKAMLEEGSGGAAVDPAACCAILERARLLGAAPVPQPQRPAPAQVDPGTRDVTEAAKVSWRILFAPGQDLLRTGSDPLLLVRELSELGKFTARARMDAVPPLAELDPERCYVSWEMELTTSAPRDSLRDVFIFVEDCCELTIEPVGVAPESAQCTADRIARALEDRRAPAGGRREYDKPDNTTSLRVPAAKLDQFVDLAGELVTVQARLSEIAARLDDPDILMVSEQVERLTAALRENSMSIRMLPIRGTFERFRRLVHDLARDLGKDVELTIEGAETELDKTVIEQLGDPLMHLIRNSMDHGIEAQAVRAARGKRATATIKLSARHSGGSVLIGVSDDGGGIDREAVLNRALDRRLVAAGTPLSDAEVYEFIFQPGFSTASQVTGVSGRGVGMDVVRQRVDALRGAIEIQSVPGVGTSVMLRLPLTLAIIDGLLVTVGADHFVLPLVNTVECVELSGEDVDTANGNQIAIVRGEIIPYICLRDYFGVRTPRPSRRQIIVVETEEGRHGFEVDGVLGNCQAVIKNLGRFYRRVQVISGATVLGDGSVALVLDAHRLVQEAIRASLRPDRGIHSGPAAVCGSEQKHGSWKSP